jgi:hypothetical protein
VTAVEHALGQMFRMALATFFLAVGIKSIREGGDLLAAFELMLGIATAVEVPIVNARYQRKKEESQ